VLRNTQYALRNTIQWPVTTNIFLRELRTVWEKADPEPLGLVRQQAAKLGIDLSKFKRKDPKICEIRGCTNKKLQAEKALIVRGKYCKMG